MFCRNSREVLFKNSFGKYLQENGTVGDQNSAVIVTEEVVSSRISRFKIGEKYISCKTVASLSEIKDDFTLFVCEKRYKMYSDAPIMTYYTIGGLCLSLTNFICCQEDSDLILESAFEEQLYRKFTKEGIVTWQGCFYGIEIARDKVLAEKHSRISNLFYDPIFEEFLKDETMKRLLDRIYGTSYHLTTYSSNTLRKEDRDGRFFHVDYPYHNIPSPYSNEILGIQVIFALDDFTVENGATMYIPGSHKEHKFPDKSVLFCLENSKYTIVKKGSIILYRGDIWHSQGINITETPRVAILANFSPLRVPAKDNVVSHVSSSKCDFQIVDGKVLI